MWILVMTLMLVFCSYTDIKDRYVDVRIVAIFYTVGLILLPVKLSGVIPVIILVVFRFLKKGLGSGDILIFFVIGFFSGLYDTLQIMMISSFFVGAYGIIVFLLKKRELKYAMPFVPFILAGVVVFWGMKFRV